MKLIRREFCTFIGALLLAIIGMASISITPVHSPFSLLVIKPTIWVYSVLGSFHGVGKYLGAVIGVLIPAVLYLLMCKQIVKTGNVLPKESRYLAALIFLMSFVFAVLGWGKAALAYGNTTANYLVLYAVLPSAVIIPVGIIKRNTFTINESLILHWVFYAWLAWGAFPLYGKL